MASLLATWEYGSIIMVVSVWQYHWQHGCIMKEDADIPMGIDPAPFLANLFPYFFELSYKTTYFKWMF